MTNNKYLGIFSIVVCALLSGCQDDWLQDGNGASAEVGDEIIFGGSLTYNNASNARTRTVYGDKNDIGTEIKWYEGDVVRIYCNEAIAPSNIKGVDYKVNDVVSPTENPTDGTAQDKDESTLSRATDETSGLQWGGEKVHEFFGIYPSPDMFEPGSAEANAYAFNFTNNAFTGYVPNSQEPSSFRKNASKDATGAVTYTMYPAMRYAYMLARTSANPKESKTVGLTFYPVVTAIEVTITNAMSEGTANSTIADISMVGVSSVATDASSEAPAIAGKFTSTYNSTDGKWDNTYAADANKFTSVSIPVKTTSVVTGTGASTVVTETTETTYPAVTLRKGDKLKFTVFLVLDNDASLSQLQLNMMIGSSMKSATLNGTNMEGFKIEAKKKNFITNIPLSYNNNTSVSNWMAGLDDNTNINLLSIPGAGGAWSGASTTNEDGTKEYTIKSEYSREQNLSFDELWERGVRCFEIQTSNGESSSLIYCNNESTGITFGNAVTAIQEKIKGTATEEYPNGTEFAYIIVTYNHNGDVDADRNSGTYQKNLSSYVNGLSNVIQWTKETTVGDARGNLVFISRPGSIGIDVGWHGLGTGNANILSILGWGFMPDQWYARGFGKVQPWYENSPDGYDINTVEDNTKLRPFTANANQIETLDYAAYYTKDRSNFGYYGVTSSTGIYGNLSKCNVWAQEWKRVVPQDGITVEKGEDKVDGSTSNGRAYNYYWPASQQEKWDDVEEALTKSINDPTRENYEFYINSLCGYFVSKNIPLSYYPALNVQRYSDGEADINPDGKYQNLVSYNVTGGVTGWFGINFNVEDTDWRGRDVPSAWGPYYPTAGYAGDIATYAKWINGKFYEKILDIGADNLTGPLGIVLMDCVDNDKNENPAGYYLPQIIVNNNFRTNTASVRTMSIGTSTYNGEPLATRKQRGSATNGQMSITWE